ncbi:hypothetical protein [Calothrix sp. NIES-2098]|uniref:hypothetical protein n=1 Tax=Calothrix sp. NIES-2098 TaxID=1954171 RepID=UPI000B5E4ACC|nr:hypothetical protein NIES2098_42000 [Calothrix sp. NIES-2098]
MMLTSSIVPGKSRQVLQLELPLFTLNVSNHGLADDLVSASMRKRQPRRICARSGCMTEVRKKGARICSYCREGRKN